MTETQTFVVNDGLNPRTDWDWEPHDADLPVAVYFEPFHGLWPIYCSCYGIYDDYAVLKVPPKSEGEQTVTRWFPPEGWSWVIVPEIFVRPQ